MARITASIESGGKTRETEIRKDGRENMLAVGHGVIAGTGGQAVVTDGRAVMTAGRAKTDYDDEFMREDLAGFSMSV